MPQRVLPVRSALTHPRFPPGFPQALPDEAKHVLPVGWSGRNGVSQPQDRQRFTWMLQKLARYAEFDSLDSSKQGYKLRHGVVSFVDHRMKVYFRIGVAFCVIALSISAFAGSVETFNYSSNVTGVNNTTVQGTFNYNTSTDTFTLASLSFAGNSIFNGISGKDIQPQSGDTFVLNETISGYTVSYTIVLNPLTGTYTASGSISYGATKGMFYNQVPEGGALLSYLLLSGSVLFCGIWLAGKQRRQFTEN